MEDGKGANIHQKPLTPALSPSEGERGIPSAA